MAIDDDAPTEILTDPVSVQETRRLYRLTPAVVDLLKASYQTALVPADSEEDARVAATRADPLGQDWRDTRLFNAESNITPERHVIGDVVFRSVPISTKISKSKRT